MLEDIPRHEREVKRLKEIVAELSHKLKRVNPDTEQANQLRVEAEAKYTDLHHGVIGILGRMIRCPKPPFADQFICRDLEQFLDHHGLKMAMPDNNTMADLIAKENKSQPRRKKWNPKRR